MPSFGEQSLSRLSTAHPLLQRLFHEVVKHRDCSVICGHRGQEDQETAFREGKSKAHWGQSKHNYVPSLAVDVMPYPLDWGDIQRIKDFSHFVKGVAAAMDIKVQWGGEFKNFFDGPHWELIDTYDSKIPS